MTRTGWIGVCQVAQLVPERGVAALVGARAVALFLLQDGRLYAVGHRDPFSGSNVIARGLVGTVGEGEQQRDTVASPMDDHVFDLDTGACLTAPGESLPTYPVRVVEGEVQVCVTPRRRHDVRAAT